MMNEREIFAITLSEVNGLSKRLVLSPSTPLRSAQDKLCRKASLTLRLIVRLLLSPLHFSFIIVPLFSPQPSSPFLHYPFSIYPFPFLFSPSAPSLFSHS